MCSGERVLLSSRAKWGPEGGTSHHRRGWAQPHTPHSTSLSGPMHPAMEDSASSLLKCPHKDFTGGPVVRLHFYNTGGAG